METKTLSLSSKNFEQVKMKVDKKGFKHKVEDIRQKLSG